jgi:hypothetical protein
MVKLSLETISSFKTKISRFLYVLLAIKSNTQLIPDLIWTHIWIRIRIHKTGTNVTKFNFILRVSA